MARTRSPRLPFAPGPSPPASLASDPPTPWGVRGLVVAGGLCYLGLFFQVSPHSVWPTYLLIPDTLIRSTFGGEEFDFTLADRGPILLLAAAVLGIGWGIGRTAIELLGLRRALTGVERIAFGALTGLSGLSTWTLLIGWLWGLHPEWLVVGPPIGFALLGLVCELRGCFLPAAVGERSPRPAEPPAGRSRWWCCLVPFAIVVLLGSLLPPWEFDVLEYHLQIPKEWHAQGRIGFVPHNVYGNMPLGAEMHALFAMTLAVGADPWWSGALAGKTVTGLIAVVTALAVGAAGTRCWSARTGAIAAVLFLATPWVVQTSMAGLIDSVVGSYLFLAAYALWRWWQESSVVESAETAPRRRVGEWLVMAGFLAGSAAACKYPGAAFVVLPLGAVTLLPRPNASTFRVRGVATVVFALSAAVGGGAWYAKNAVVAGNPAYPLLYGVFGGETRTPEKDVQWRRAHRPGGPTGDAYGTRELAQSIAQVGWRSPWLSPLLVPLALAAIAWRTPRRPLLPWLLLIGFVLTVWWCFTHRIDRFWIPLLPVVALVAGAGVMPLAERFGRRVVDGVLATGLALQLLVCISPGSSEEPFGNNRFFMSLDKLRDASTLPAHRQLNERVPVGAKVLLVGDARPFYLRPAAIYNTCFDDDVLERLIGGKSRAERLAALRSAGVSHVYVDWSEIGRYRSPGNYGFPEFVTRELMHQELVREQRLLRLLPIDVGGGELFEVTVDGE